jgi:hypothetical protein
MEWVRVSKKFPCVICGREDWDTFCPDLKLACCMRVQSDRPCKNGGWLHSLDSKVIPFIPKSTPRAPRINASRMLADWGRTNSLDRLREFAEKLGVQLFALMALGCTWAQPYNAWAFPMFDGRGCMVGIRLRSESGHKWAVAGSRQGIFVPQCDRKPRVYLTEGPTDTAAVISLGMFAIGRPSCQCGAIDVAATLEAFGAREAVIVADSDRPGLEGAQRLAGALPVPCCIYLPPTKDIREFVNMGGTRQMIENTIDGCRWQQPKNLCKYEI